LEMKKYSEAVLACNDVIKATLQPLPSDYKARASAKAMSNDPQGAAEDYSGALELENKAGDPEKMAANIAWLLTHRGQAYLACRADRPALHDFEEVLRQDPKNREALCGRGLARVRLNQVEAGVSDARQALRDGESTARLCYQAARVYAQAASSMEVRDRSSNDQRLERQDRAVQLIGQAMTLLPADQRAAFWLDSVQKDSCLTAIRRTRAFSQLEEKYNKKSSASGGGMAATGYPQ
jgi:tetratricopeptide (TPR) repeat protein